jgi:formamidopyrimidine-DNA glycosylase
MPELPEVETTRRGIAPHALGECVTGVVVRDPRLRWPVPAELQTQLPGSRIESIRRRGKYILFATDTGVLIVHLGMSGSLRVLESNVAPGKHDHVDVQLGNGRILRYNDPRRFGCMLWTLDDPARHPLLCELGPEPLEDDFSGEYLFERSRGRRSAVKSFIMDSHVVVGVGNIYANEALYAAGIRPTRAAGRIALGRYQRLAADIRAILAAAVSQGGTTLRDFVGGDGKPGYFKQQLNVYDRAGQPCPGCAGLLMEKRIGQRSSVYCRRCQT